MFRDLRPMSAFIHLVEIVKSMEMELKVSEIFYSLQGEGARAGEASIFIRLQGCKARHACLKSGVVCDTEFESGKVFSLDNLRNYIARWDCRNIVWTGGEPTDQLTEGMITYFKELGYYQCVETSGLNPVPAGVDFISLSPKVAEHVLKKNFPTGVQELRYVRHEGQSIPNPSVLAQYHYLSPHSDGWEINTVNLKHCITLCLENPIWRLSLQQHKIWKVL